ncbi:MAG TPA: SRPBCC domain-containing protein [Rhizobiaceae bacterium]|nr:SRPBCC domain-containing protein [Rhizobiaceae bacterium]
MSSKGSLEGNDTVRFERSLPGSATRVWEHLTGAKHVPVWFGGEGAIEPRVGGAVKLMGGMFTGAVKEWQPGKRLVHSMSLTGVPAPETTVSYDLAEHDGAVHLTLSQGPLAAPFLAGSFSGWHTFLDRLEAMLRGEDPGDVMQAMQTHRNAYLKDYPEGAAFG